MQINPYLNFNGNCKEAIEYYAEALGGTIEVMMPHAGTPAEEFVPAEMHDKIMHARLSIDGNVIMASDTLPDHEVTPQGFAVSLQIPNVDRANQVFTALSDGGKTTMPFQKTFWAEGFGMCVDRFGIPWMVNCETANN